MPTGTFNNFSPWISVVRTVSRSIATILLLPVLAAAIDCTAPENARQRLVCSKSDLLRVQQELDSLFEQALSAASQLEGRDWRKAVLDLKRGWEKDDSECGTDVECIKSVGKSYVIVLNQNYMGSIDRDKETAEYHRKRKESAAAAEAALANAHAKYAEVSEEKQRILSTLEAMKEFGAVPKVAATFLARDAGADELQAKAAEIEAQIASLRKLLTTREEQGLHYARKTFQTLGTQTPAADELSKLILSAETTPDGRFKAYRAAKNLEAAVRALEATKQRSGRAIQSASSNMAKAAKHSADLDMAAAAKATGKALNDVAAKAQTNDPKDEAELSRAVERLEKQDLALNFLIRKAEVLSTATGKRVYQGCSAWAKRGGLIANDAPVRYFKDAETNNAADRAANYGRHLCACMTVEIAGDQELTDQAKLEIAHEFETSDRIRNQALAGVVAVAGGRCQVKGIDDLSGGALSRPR